MSTYASSARIALLVSVAALPAVLLAATGGPDAGDLVYTDSDESDGPPHATLDMSSATDPGLADDDTVTVDLPFTFQWYEEDQDQVTISSNGVVFFDGASSDSSGDCPGTGGAYNGIAAFWDDWDAGVVSYDTFGYYPNRVFAVQWEGAHATAGGSGTVQLWLLEGRNEAAVVLDDITFGSSSVDGGASAVIGAQPGPSGGLDYACAGGVSDGTTVWFGVEGQRPSASERSTDDLDDPWIGTDTKQYLGRTLAGGDLDGDGYDDIVIGNQDDEQAFVIFGSLGSVGTTIDQAHATISLDTAGGELATGLAVGDLDGDGLDDVALGAPEDSTSDSNAGAVFVVAGTDFSGELSVPTDAGWSVYGPTTVASGAGGTVSFLKARAGTSVYVADVDGDGYGDLLVGAPEDDSTDTNAGAAYLMYGASSILGGGSSSLDSPDAVWVGEIANDGAGKALFAEDVDGDGAAEVFVTAPYADSGIDTSVGRVYMLSGQSWSGTGALASVARATVVGDDADDELGWAVAVGDFDADGNQDLAVTAPLDDTGARNSGSVYLFSDASTLSGSLDAGSDADAQVQGDVLIGQMGYRMVASDLNLDGADDLVVSKVNDGSYAHASGAVVVLTDLTSSASLHADDAAYTLYGAVVSGALGTGLTVLDDHQGDGYADVVASAPYADADGVTGAGQTYVWSVVPDFPDKDADGFVDSEVGGLDCDDSDSGAWPGNTETAGNLADDDCDGWIDDVVMIRDDQDDWEYDLADQLGSVTPTTFDFESASAGDDLSSAYTSDDLTLSASGSVTASTSVWDSSPNDTMGAKVTAGSSTNDLSMVFAADVDAVAFQVLDPEGAYDLTASVDGATLISGELLDLYAPNRAGGATVGLLFSEAIDTLTIEGDTSDAFGIDDLQVIWADDTDRDGDGYSENDGDCDDADSTVSPGATEDLSNGIDDDCDGVIDAGDADTYTDYATWSAAAGLDEETVDFEDLSIGETVDTDYDSLGVSFDGSASVVTSVDGTTPRDTRGAQASGTSVTISFDELQPAIALWIVDGLGDFTVTGQAEGATIYTTTVDGAGEGTSGGVFVGLVYEYGVDEVTIEDASSTDTWGMDDVVFSVLGLDDADGDGYTESEGDCDDTDASVGPDATETWYDGIDSDCDEASDYDADGDGYDLDSYGGADCDDGSSAVNPDATETWYDGVDADCDGASDYDADSDGFDDESYGGTDCDDSSDAVNPDATETWYDGVDDDCDSTDDDDADGDGYSATGYASGALGSGDCDDTDATVGPGETETWYDGVDTDCDGGSDYDADGDGYDDESYGGTDCDDSSATVYPGASSDRCYDGVDTDCDGGSDYDCDGDGYDSEDYGGTDCDDTDDTIYPGATDTPKDGIDSDCDGALEFDDDLDGYDGVEDGGDDCDDTDPTVNPGATETWYDGVDSDCDGASDYDADSDGYTSDAYGGTDCDDTDQAIHPGAVDYYYDGIDNDCDGLNDYDQDADGYESTWYGGTDCDDTDADVFPGATETWYDGTDSDCDGASDYDADSDGYDSSLYSGSDCDDADDTVNPGATEVAGDGVDQDCDGTDDVDADGDGWYSSDDCDDGDASVYPGAPDTCYDGVDSDCGGEDDNDCDGDGVLSDAHGGTDCDDDDASVYPGATETWYDGVDGDCDGGSDYDQDGDGHTAQAWGGDDCDDANPDVHGGLSIDDCGGGDEDCDGEIDEDCAALEDDTGSPTDDTGSPADDTGSPTDDTGGNPWTDPNADWQPPQDDGVDPGLQQGSCGCSTGGPTGGLAVALLGLLALSRRRKED